MSHSIYSPLSHMGVPYFKAGDQTSIDNGNLSRKETEASLKVMMNTGTNGRTSECSIKDEPDRKDEVAKFIEEYKANNFKDVPVTKMRHIISMLLMEVYVENSTSYTRKVKGIWKKRPTGWPAGIPYVDPNNKLRSDDGEHCCKPKKSLLAPMLMHLVTKYMHKQGENKAPSDDRVLTPHQVEDVIDDQPLDWDPIKEMLPRLGSKLAFLKERNVVDTASFQDLCKRFVLLKHDIGACDWLEKAHSLEHTADTIKHRYMTSHSDLLASLQNVKLRGTDRFIPHSAAMSPARTFDAVKEASVGETLMSTMNVNKRGLNTADNVMSLLKIDERAFTGPQLNDDWMDTKTHDEVEFDVDKAEKHCVVAVDNSDVSKLNIHTKTTELPEGLIQAVQLRCVNPTPEVSECINEQKKEFLMIDDQDLMLALADLPQLSADVLDFLGASNYANAPCDERALNEYVTSLGVRPESDPPPAVAAAQSHDISCVMSEQFHFGSVPMTAVPSYNFSSYNAPATPGSSHISGQMESLYLENIMDATLDISSDQFLTSETVASNSPFTGMPSSNIPLVVEQMEDEDDMHYTGPSVKRQCSYM